MDKNLPRWIFQSVAEHFRLVAEDISLPYFVEGIDERSEETMQSNHVEARVTGPSMKEVSNGYYNVDVVINFLFTKAMDPVDSNAYDLIQWTGVFADEMLLPIPIYKKGTGADDNGLMIGCLQIGKGKNEAARIYHFGQLDKDTPVRQSEVDAVFHMDYTGREIGTPTPLPVEATVSTLVMTSGVAYTIGDTLIGSPSSVAALSDSATFVHDFSAPASSVMSLTSDVIAEGILMKPLSDPLSVSDLALFQLDKQFTSTWNTSNTSSGSSNTYRVQLPLESTGNYNFTVYWGDGNQDTITVWNDAATLHTYNTPGIYTIGIDGEIQGLSFDNTGDKEKIANVQAWGQLKLGSAGRQFRGCKYLTSNAPDTLNLAATTNLQFGFQLCNVFDPSDAPDWITSNVLTANGAFRDCPNFNQDISGWDVAKTTDMSQMFQAASSFNQDISSWNTANVTNMTQMFLSAAAFDQDISTWNIENVTTMANMFDNVTLSTANYDSLLIGWEAQTEKTGVNFSGGNSTYSEGTANAARETLINTSNWVITDGGLA